MKLEPDVLRETWVKYKADNLIEDRNKLIEHYEPLVSYVSSRINVSLSSSMDKGDLYSYGIFGLFDALEKFDIHRGIKFETYGISRIRGAIIDELRALDWVPRSVRTSLKELEAARLVLEGFGNYNPSDSDLAEALDWDIAVVRRVQGDRNSLSVFSIQSMLEASESEAAMSAEDRLEDIGESTPEFAIKSKEIIEALANGISKLSDKELILLALYYVEGLTLSEIGAMLNVTESRVCQIHTKAISDLQLKLKG
jgi:RNA polymerase sigma factor for flagellar operon FliA